MRDSLLFYVSLGRAPQPRWFAHNPLWKPVYLLLFLLLALSLLTGWLMPDRPVLGGLYLPHLHRWLADGIGIWTVAHLFSVVLQDLKGTGADISAMISGSRCFTIEREGPVGPKVADLSIRLDDITKR